MLFIEISIFILGLIFGSFIAALTWRYAHGISIADGRSICPKCGKQIAWFDNIPLLSFILLGGKCRNCKKMISIRYPLIELSTGLGFVIIDYFATTVQDPILYAVYSIVVFLILESIFIIDLEEGIIPDSFVFFGITLSTIYYFLFNSSLLIPNLLAGFVSATFFLLVYLFTRGRGMGLGDVKFAVLGGLIVGPRLFLIWLFLAFLTGAIVGIILILGKIAGFKSKIAFGPFLVVAIPLALMYGEKILSWIHIG